jgi:glyoxylate/hydroxypyruvate reductase A
VIDARLLGAMRPGGYLLNAARGGHMVAADVLAALESGHLAGAALDVFEPEPLPPESPFWTHPKVILTPHAASITIPASAAPQVVENIHRARAGRPLINLVDFSAGY